MFGLRQAGIEINRKMLAELAVNDLHRFWQISRRGQAKPQLALPSGLTFDL